MSSPRSLPELLYSEAWKLPEKNTWVQLDAFYEFNKADLIQKVLRTEIKRLGVLDEVMTKDLIVCATHSEDLTKFQEEELLRQLVNLQAEY